MNRGGSGAAGKPPADSPPAGYMLPISLIGSGAVLFLLAAMVDWMTGSKASPLPHAASAFLTLTAVVFMGWGVVLLLRRQERLISIGAAIGVLLAVSGLLLEVCFFFFGRVLVDSPLMAPLMHAILVLQYPGELVCDSLGIELIRHADDVRPDRLLTEWPIIGAANLLAWCILGVLVAWIGSRELSLSRH